MLRRTSKSASRTSASTRESSAGKSTLSTRRKLAELTNAALHQAYPSPVCALIHSDPFELLVATILSAQCTDKRVNQVTPELFRRFPNAQAFADATVEEIGEAIKTCGLYRSKAQNIFKASQLLVKRYGGHVPKSFESLVELPGVGRKTANCVLGNAFRIASGFVVDAHVMRLSRKIGLSDGSTPEKVEADLNQLFPQDEWIDASHRLIFLGREHCIARRPQCSTCPLTEFCLKRP